MSNLMMSEIDFDVYFTETYETGDIIVEFYKLQKEERKKVCEAVIISDLNIMSIEPNSKYVVDNYDYLVLTRAIQISFLNDITINPITISDVEKSGLILVKNDSIDIIRSYLEKSDKKLKLYEGNKNSSYTYKNEYIYAVNQ